MRSTPPNAPRQVRGVHQSKSASVRAAAAAPSKRQRTKWQRDQEQQHLLIWGGLALAAVIALIFAAGWLYDSVYLARQTAGIVYGTTISTGDIVERIRPLVRTYETQLRQSPNGRDSRSFNANMDQFKRSMPDQIFDQMVEERILQHEADARGLQVTSDEVDARMREQVAQYAAATAPTPTPGGEPTATPAAAPTAEAGTPASPTPIATLEPAAYQDALKTFLDRVGGTEQQLRDDVRSSLVREKVETAIEADVPTVQEQVHARHILVPTQQQADELLQQLQQGGNFEEIAKANSTDPGSKDKGGDLGWFPRGIMNTQFEQAAFALQPGELSGVVQSPNGYHIIQVLERDPARPVSPDQLTTLKNKAFQDWLQAQRRSPDVQTNFTPAEHDWVLRQLGVRP